MEVKIEETWKDLLSNEFSKEYFLKLTEFVKEEYHNHTVYPPAKNIFAAFDYCPVDKVKVVLIGQDPYHGPGQANGLCFSVQEGVKFPPSLRNIFKELEADVGKAVPESGDLSSWAKQGVLMLNATLTVRAKSAGSHQKQGWEIFTDAVIRELINEKEKIVFILWGAYAQKKGALINKNNHFVITSAHPSPFSAYNGFFDSKPFSKANGYLNQIGEAGINW